MYQCEFGKLVDRVLEKCKQTMTGKSDEYSRGDKLHNFKATAAFLRCTPEKALWGFVAKHLIALQDFIYDLDKCTLQSESRWDEKINDAICYLLLLKGLVTERHQTETAKNKDEVLKNLREGLSPDSSWVRNPWGPHAKSWEEWVKKANEGINGMGPNYTAPLRYENVPCLGGSVLNEAIKSTLDTAPGKK